MYKKIIEMLLEVHKLVFPFDMGCSVCQGHPGDVQVASVAHISPSTLPQENVDPNVIQHLTSLWLVS